MLQKETEFINQGCWSDFFNASVTICDRDGIIVYVNEKAAKQFEKYGGKKLLGKDLLDCHPEPSRSRFKQMLIEPIENIYTTEKDGLRKMIVQKPWMDRETFMGVVEFSFELPANLPLFQR
ncbi:MAG TPA: diguanylate cyclase [Prolixibacteraceae bacterium]|nr:diguanylate cyclase [Prolixibacteraceae bacterium]